MVTAFAALPAEQQQYLSGLTALHDGEQHYRGRYDGPDDADKVYPQAEHPVVRTHPSQWPPCPFREPDLYTPHHWGWRLQESEQLLQKNCLSTWSGPSSSAASSGRLVRSRFWDNRSAQHQALWDYFPHRRRGWRVTIQGEVTCTIRGKISVGMLVQVLVSTGPGAPVRSLAADLQQGFDQRCELFREKAVSISERAGRSGTPPPRPNDSSPAPRSR